VVTFARFYALHVLLLPPATLLLIGAHIYLVRKHGVAPLPGDEALPRKKFFPGQVFRDTVAIFIAFAILFTLAVAARVPLERIADPTDTSYIPRPEWYFLFLFQTLKWFEGPLEVVGAVVLPGLAVAALILVPFIDRGRAVRVTRRTAAFTAVTLAGVTWTGLTVAAVATTPKPVTPVQIDFSEPTDWMHLSPEELAGIGYFRGEACATCHNLVEGKAKVGPDLALAAPRKSAAEMIAHFQNPAQVVPGTAMPAVQLTGPQLNALAAFLLKLTPRNAAALQAAPEFAVTGAMVYQANRCGACHQVNGMGMRIGPPLNGLARRRDAAWVEQHFREPQKLSPGTIMPPYRFTPAEMKALSAYLFTLPE